MGDWLLAKASVKGTSHINSGSPCQDASIIRTDHSGKWLIAVASDGAGSAKRADEGADFVTDKFANALTELSKELESQKPGSWVSDFVINVILKTRSHLRNQAGDEGIQDFNCTLVACLLGLEGGFSIHIGDGAIFGQRQDPSSTHKTGPDNVNYVSPPENGEYANETYFLTEGYWIKHIRITPMPPLDWVLLCTDGGAALSMKGETEPKPGFLFPVIKKLKGAKNDHQRDSLLEGILKDSKADKVTGDDKTLTIAIRAIVPIETILAEPELKETPKDDVTISVTVDNSRITNTGLRLIHGCILAFIVTIFILLFLFSVYPAFINLSPQEPTEEITAPVSEAGEQKEDAAEEANGSNAVAGDPK